MKTKVQIEKGCRIKVQMKNENKIPNRKEIEKGYCKSKLIR